MNGAETNINYVLIYLYFSWNTKKNQTINKYFNVERYVDKFEIIFICV
jgi:hypothetical protein